MARLYYRGNLSSAVFPMTLADAGRTVINPQYDQNFDRRVDPAGEQKSVGIPQAIFMENVVPTVSGYQSVGYNIRNSMPPESGSTGVITVVDCFQVADVDAGRILTLARNGTVSSYADVVSTNIGASISWQYALGDIPSGARHYTAFVRGTHYWSDGTDLFSYVINPTTKQITFTDISGSVTGVTPSDIKCIVSSYNYLIALMNDGSIAWSSTTTPTDFTPSLVTGAGSETPSGAQGANFLKEHPSGFYIYCDNSIAFAQYTGNARYPWKFVPVADSGGYSSPYQAFGGYNIGVQYGIDNSNKLQVIEGNKASLVGGEISTFLERKKNKDVFDYTTNIFSKINGFVQKAISFVLDRYIFVSISFGTPNAYTHIFVYDVLLQRYGILKKDHTFTVSDDQGITLIPTSPTQTVYAVSFDVYDPQATIQGVLLLGKFQFVRDKALQLQEVIFECGRDPDLATQNIEILDYQTDDGKTFLPPVVLPLTTSTELLKADCFLTAKNHSILLKGAFDINTIELVARVAGERT